MKLEPISEEVLKQTAKIVGPQSAARQALDDATKRRAAGQEVMFARQGASILVIDKRVFEAPGR